jgi:hypothetical protein
MQPSHYNPSLPNPIFIMAVLLAIAARLALPFLGHNVDVDQW